MTMRCDRCHQALAEDEATLHHGQHLCEDCYMDAFSPVRTCDPWAVRSASLSRDHGEGPGLSAAQEDILRILEESGGVDLETLAARAGRPRSDVERDIAALRHMEKVRGALREGRKVICLW